jgi:hypothetical protein
MTTRSGASFLAFVRMTVKDFSDKIALPHNPDQVQHQFLLQQWRESEEILVEKVPMIPGSQGLSSPSPSRAIHVVSAKSFTVRFSSLSSLSLAATLLAVDLIRVNENESYR